jgi:hypothetical protein
VKAIVHGGQPDMSLLELRCFSHHTLEQFRRPVVPVSALSTSANWSVAGISEGRMASAWTRALRASAGRGRLGS